MLQVVEHQISYQLLSPLLLLKLLVLLLTPCPCSPLHGCLMLQVVEHQRLAGSGYVFTASLPPYLTAPSSHP